MERNVDEWDRPVALSHLVNATHGAEHVKLDDSVRLAVQHLNEALAALCRKASAIDHAPERYARNAFGLPQPTNDQQFELFDLYREFFDLTYSTISALASVLNRLSKRVRGVPWNSNERFLAWIGGPTQPHYWHRDRSTIALKAARDFRTVYVHTPQWKPFDWKTFTIDGKASVALTGTHPPAPPGVELLDEHEGEWVFLAPDPNHILHAFATLAGYYFATLNPHYEVDPYRCKWEEQGLGSAPGVAFEDQVAVILAREQGGTPNDYAPELYRPDGPLPGKYQ